MALSQFLPMASDYNGILAATVLGLWSWRLDFLYQPSIYPGVLKDIRVKKVFNAAAFRAYLQPLP